MAVLNRINYSHHQIHKNANDFVAFGLIVLILSIVPILWYYVYNNIMSVFQTE